MCVCYDGVGVTTYYDDTTTDADTTVIAAVIGGSIGGLVIVMVVIVGVMIAVVLNMRKKQLKHGKSYIFFPAHVLDMLLIAGGGNTSDDVTDVDKELSAVK